MDAQSWFRGLVRTFPPYIGPIVVHKYNAFACFATRPSPPNWPIPTLPRANFSARVRLFRHFQGSNLPNCSCVAGLAQSHLCAHVQHVRQFLRSSLPTCSCVVGLAPGHFVHRYSTFASCRGPACLLVRVLLALPGP